MKKLLLAFSTALISCNLSSAADFVFKPALPFGTWWTAPARPTLDITTVNNGPSPATCEVTLTINTDFGDFLYRFDQSSTVAAGDSCTMSFGFDLEPGFYNCIFSSGDRVIAQHNIGFEPERIYSPADFRPDFAEFWQRARADLDSISPEFDMIRFPEQDTDKSKAYKVTMRSVGRESLTGFLMLPKKKGRYPAIINYMGYGSGPAYCDFLPSYDGEFIYFQQNIRGQGLNKETNTHGEWMVENLEDIENYYYRNAFMDAVRGVDFVFTLPQFDGVNIFAEGGSQGGALTLAATALDKRIVAAAPFVPFLSDYPDYFRLSEWIGSTLRNAAKEKGMTDMQLMRNMSYFDIKNLATLIDVPVLMAVGLQDTTCPPHTNFAGYNLISSPKQFIIYPDKGHGVSRPHWDNAHIAFFRKYMKPATKK
jgi:cephalosporin-C deacetylase